MRFSALTLPERIVHDLGGKSQPAQEGVRALAAAVGRGSCRAAHSSLQQWTELFRKICGQDWPRPKVRLDRLARHYAHAHDPARPEIVLFALQGWYVLVVKMLVGRALAAVRSARSAPAGRLTSFCTDTALHSPACASPLAATNRRGKAATSFPTAFDAGGFDGLRTLVESIESGGWFSALGATDPWCGAPFNWTALAWSPALERAVLQTAARIARYDPIAITAHAAGGGDLLKPLYASLFPRAVRHGLGEYYTPDWLAEHVLDQVGYHGQPEARLLDPTCGSGTFLLAALRRWREGGGCKASASAAVTPTPPVVGFDLHPLAVASARANYLLAIADLVGPAAAVGGRGAGSRRDPGPAAGPSAFDFVVGNPPWIAWDNLPPDYREATKPHWQRYGLFSLSGNEARHGGGKKDLSMLVLYAAADRYLASGGRLGMVITQTLFQTKGAGDGFRRFRLGGDGPPLAVLRVDDLVELRPFAEAANWTSVLVLQKGEPTHYPVTYVKWSAGNESTRCREEGQQTRDAYSRSEMLAQPIDPGRPTPPWIVRPREESVDPLRGVGRADYTAHLGANSGGANAVFWMEVRGRGANGLLVRNLVGKAKRCVEPVETELEPDLLYPLVRWIDVRRWSARPSACLLLAQDPQTRAGHLTKSAFAATTPASFAYLQRFQTMLTARAAYRRYQQRQPFYSMYNVGPYTLAPAKVIWRRMDRKIRAAVAEPWDDPLLGPRPVVPQETCVLIACSGGDEAHYLCALLNSASIDALVASHSVAGGKGFGSPSILDYLPLRKFDPADPRHAELATLSRRLHVSTEQQVSVDRESIDVDRLAVETLRI